MTFRHTALTSAANERTPHDDAAITGRDTMSKIERTIEELYADDPERADAVVFGRESGVEPARLSGRRGTGGDGRRGRRRDPVLATTCRRD